MNGFSEEQILEIRSGRATFDTKLDALATFTQSVVEHRGQASNQVKAAFFDAGYTEAHMIDVVIVVGDKVISNYIHNLTGFAIDFPEGTDTRRSSRCELSLRVSERNRTALPSTGFEG